MSFWVLSISWFYCCFLAVTTVDSGSKALQFLGLHENEQTNPDQPSVSPKNHQVLFSWDFLGFIEFYVLGFPGKFIILCPWFTGSRSESYYYRLLYAWNDRLWFAQESQGNPFIYILYFIFCILLSPQNFLTCINILWKYATYNFCKKFVANYRLMYVQK